MKIIAAPPFLRYSANPLARLEANPGWWSGKALARQQLMEQATSDKERDEHYRKLSEYELAARKAGA